MSASPLSAHPLSVYPAPYAAEAPLSSIRKSAFVPLNRVACFAVQADADPGILPRVLGLFAKRSLVPDRLTGHRGLREGGPAGDDRGGQCGADSHELAIDVQVAGLDAAETDYLARCLRQIPGVVAVLTAEKATAD
ncbi:MAG: hypothetical protein WD711_01940 [Dongiaceae bacterium]